MNYYQLMDFVKTHFEDTDQLLKFTPPEAYYSYLECKGYFNDDKNKKIQSACILLSWEHILMDSFTTSNFIWMSCNAFTLFKDEHIYVLNWLRENEKNKLDDKYKDFQAKLLEKIKNIV